MLLSCCGVCCQDRPKRQVQGSADRVAYSRLCSVMSMEGRPCGSKCYPIPAAWSVTATVAV